MPARAAFSRILSSAGSGLESRLSRCSPRAPWRSAALALPCLATLFAVPAAHGSNLDHALVAASPAGVGGGESTSRSLAPPRPSWTETERDDLRERLERHLEVRFQAIAPLLVFLEPPTVQGRGIWTQPTLGLTLGARAFEHLFARITLLAYPDPGRRGTWMPDFTWSLGYDDWRPWRPFLIHANYTANRYPWRASAPQDITDLLKGVNTAGLRWEIPRQIRDALWMPPPLWLGGSLAVHYAPRFDIFVEETPDDLLEGSHQGFGSLTLAGTWAEHWFVDFRIFFYPWQEQQQPWDPDYTYSFGWMDWRPWSLTLRWNNYAGNRWWFREAPGFGGHDKGVLMVDFKLGF